MSSSAGISGRRSAEYCPLIGSPAKLEIERERSAWQLIGATFALYRRYPWLFLVLAAAVVIPYDALQLIQALRVLHGVVGVLFSLAVIVAEFTLVLPLISALHVHAIADVREGLEPKIGSVARRGLATLPLLIRAAGFAYIGTYLGLIAFIVPGVVLALQWAVVAQVATLGTKNWRGALEESKLLTEGRYRHILGLFVPLFVINFLPGILLAVLFGWHVSVARESIVYAIGVLVSSFTALAVGLLYYDLRARSQTESVATAPPTGHRLDPRSWSDEERPPGWYLDPEFPRLMYYWAADGTAAWGKRSTRTPKTTLAEWFASREPAASGEPS